MVSPSTRQRHAARPGPRPPRGGAPTLALLAAITIVMYAAATQAGTPPNHAAPRAARPSAARRLQLVQLVREDCGSCHGSRFRGGLGPPLLPAALRGKGSAMLEKTILDGRPGTPMPPWRPFLSRADVTWIVRMLKRGFPDAAN